MATEDLTVLNRRRGGIKAQITRLQTFVTEVELSGKLEVSELEVRFDKAKKLNNQLEDLRMEYYKVAEDDDLTAIEGNLEEIETDLTKIEVSLKRLYNLVVSGDEGNVIANIPNAKNTSANVKLPDIPLPKFSGKFEEWNIFKDKFVSLISSNVELSESQKLYYLRSCLIGNAKELQTVDDSFTSLFEALENRFNNKRLIVNTHINELLSMEKLQFESAKDLRLLVDQLQKHLRALKLMDLSLDKLSEVFLINIVLQKLDKESRKQFEMSLTSSELTSWNTLITFLEQRCQILENLHCKVSQTRAKYPHSNNKTRSLVMKVNKPLSVCPLCKGAHAIFKCESFLALNPIERFHYVKKHMLCINCLSPNHKVGLCQSSHVCSICKSKHNSLLHRPINRHPSVPLENVSSDETVFLLEEKQTAASDTNRLTDTKALSSCLFSKNKTVILSTAVVWVQNLYGQFSKARVILDSGSQSNFVSNDFVYRANLRKEKVNIPVSSLGGKTTTITSQVFATISNGNNSFSTSLNFLVLDKITDTLPSQKLNLQKLKIPHQSMLADPDFATPAQIDMLLGAEIYFDIVKGEQILSSSHSLIFQHTVFGYIASGTIKTPPDNSYVSYCGLATQNENIQQTIEKFWLLEDLNNDEPILSNEEEFCELHFQKTHKRDNSGRYVVQMPIKEEELGSLGNSRILAERRLQQTVKRLNKNLEMRKLYCEFLDEYEMLSHMEKVPEEDSAEISYYMPHHGVYKPEKSSTKLRIVFNASAPSTTGQSLNDILLAGKVKEDIFDIMVRFRKHKIVMTADIEKMFRQIIIDPGQRNLLRILWKTHEKDPTMVYRMNTVTYGTKCAPFLATRVLKQVALDEAANFPLASKVVLSDVYMDDIVTGCQDLESAKNLKLELTQLFMTCGMTLHKWNSNSEELLGCSNPILKEHSFAQKAETSTKTLGLFWKSDEDQFIFKVSVKEQNTFTKREVLSTIAKLYDPLGFIGPVICKAKIFLQGLWLEKIGWDDIVPEPFASEWYRFFISLKDIEKIKINRYLLNADVQSVTIVGFCDASNSAYGAVVYLLCCSQRGPSTSRILASKSRVAPLKTVSIPRLELCSCLLLSQLVKKLLASLKMEIERVILFSDSTIALAWIDSSPHRLKTFVGNRVAKIQTLTSNYQWCHVLSTENVADILSRGTSPAELLTMTLWWSGPAFLTEGQVPSSASVDSVAETEEYSCELRKHSKTNSNTDNNMCVSLPVLSKDSLLNYILGRSNDYGKLLRILSYVFRFYCNLRNPKEIRIGLLNAEEINHAEEILIRLVQSTAFESDIQNLKNGKLVSNKLKFLNVFLDDKGILRVGGRLAHANINYDSKHQMLLPKGHKITKMIFKHYHLKNLHAGPQSLLYFVRQVFCPIRGRDIAREIVHNCLTCFRHNPVSLDQIMGDLPSERVNPNSTFNNAGVDFCGPFFIRYRNQRKGVFHKVYVAIFFV